MIPTPDAITRYLQEQIRGIALSTPDGGDRMWYQKPADWIRRIWRWLARDWIRSALYGVAGVTSGWAVTLLARAWPIGGGESVSQASIALGSSLIFVVIVTGLLAGPLEAGRRLGDAAWIARDKGLWGGLAVVSAVSLVIVWIGGAEPERSEEVATLLLAGSGIAATGIVARRVIMLSDPAVLLGRKQREARLLVGELVMAGADVNRRALERVGVDGPVAEEIGAIPDPSTQSRVVQLVRYPLSVARGAWQRGEHDIALWAYYEAGVLVVEYARAAGALASNDSVLRVFQDETLDLHELAAGPAGRRLSQGITSLFIDIGTSVVGSGKGLSSQGDEQLAHSFTMSLETIVTGRIGDRRTTDVWTGIGGIERLAHSVADAGDDWTAAYISKTMLKFAPASVGARLGEIGFPAWQGILRMLERLALSGGNHPHAFGALADDLADAVDQVSELPSVMSHDTGFDVLLGTSGVRDRLISTGQRIWLAAPDTRLDDLVRFSWRVIAALRGLVDRTTDEYTRGVRTPQLAETAYQFLAGAAQRLDRDTSSEVSRGAFAGLAPHTLWVTRNLMLPEEGVVPPRALDHRELLRIYLSVWQMVIYSCRTDDAPPDWVSGEVDALVAELDDLDEAVESPLFVRGMKLLADWLDSVGWSGEGAKVRTGALALPDRRVRDLFSTEENWGYALGREFQICTGSMLSPFYQQVGAFFDESEDEGRGLCS